MGGLWGVFCVDCPAQLMYYKEDRLKDEDLNNLRSLHV